MDLEEWELLPDEGFLEIHDDGGKKIFSRKYGGGGDSTKTSFNMNYFICPSPKPHKNISDPNPHPPKSNSRLPNQLLVPVPIQFQQTPAKPPPPDHELTKLSIDEKVKAPNIGEAEQDTVSQVFFKKMKENEFVDMKMDSPKSSTGRGIAGTFQFENRTDHHHHQAMEAKTTTTTTAGNNSKMKITEKNSLVVIEDSSDSDTTKKEEEEEEEKNGGGGLNLWKWSLNGVGAICSFGVAAATICIFIFGTHHKNKQLLHHQHNQKLRFQIYTDDKSIEERADALYQKAERIKEVVHHATKLNEAISAVRGVPVTGAHITVGGYYDGL